MEDSLAPEALNDRVGIVIARDGLERRYIFEQRQDVFRNDIAAVYEDVYAMSLQAGYKRPRQRFRHTRHMRIGNDAECQFVASFTKKLVSFKTRPAFWVHTDRMKRSTLLHGGAAAAVLFAGNPAQGLASASPRTRILPLTPPSAGVPVAFLISEGTVMIDFAGPWEVFQDGDVAGRMQPAFIPYTVAETTAPLTFSGGARVVPQYDFANAPPPSLVVVPAQSDPAPATKRWLNTVAHTADVIMSVCTGAFVLAQSGLLDGHTVTTHHSSLAQLALQYPNVTVRRGARFVDSGRIATSAGLSAGIDLALHVVARYYGVDAARQTAYDMEYQSQSWLNENSNAAYLSPPAARPGFALCAVCWMEVDPKAAPSSLYHDKKYYFCTAAHKQLFDSAPQRFLNVS